MGLYYNPPQPQQPLPHVTASGSSPPPPVNNPPFPGTRVVGGALALLWAPESWTAQRSSFAIQGGLPAGDMPAGAPAPPEPEPWGLWEPWKAQGTRVLQPVLIAPPPVNAPPRSHLAAFYANRGLWPDPDWPAGRSPPIGATAGSLLPPVYVPWQIARFYAHPELQDTIDWRAQVTSYVVQPATAAMPPPPYSAASLYAWRTLWPDTDWLAQQLGFETTTLTQPPVNPPPPYSLYSFYALRGEWLDPLWDTQRSGIIVPLIPPPEVDAPPAAYPRGELQQQFATFTPNPDWETRRLQPYRGWLLPSVWQTVYALVNAGLEPTIVWIPDLQAPYGFTISTDPAFGTVVPIGTPVTVFASSGLPNPPLSFSVTVPNVTQEPLISARGQLFALGLITSETWVASDDPAGTVETQEPGSGAIVPPGTTVTMTVSLGPPPVQQTVPVPQ